MRNRRSLSAPASAPAPALPDAIEAEVLFPRSLLMACRRLTRSVAPRLALAVIALAIGAAPIRAARADIVMMADENDITISENQVDQWIFRNSSTTNSPKGKLDDALQTHISLIANTVGLTDEQRKRLELAGKGDIARFWSLVVRLKQKYPGGRMSQEKFNQMWQEVQPLTTRFAAGLHGRYSLFEKMLPGILSESQLQAYTAEEKARRVRHFRAKVEATVQILDQRVPMTDAQRKKFIELTVTKTEPPLAFGQNDFYLILWRMSQIPEADLRPVFDEEEWKVLNVQLDQVRGMRQWVEQMEGKIEEDPNNPAPAVAF